MNFYNNGIHAITLAHETIYYHPTKTAADIVGEVIAYANTLLAGKVP